MAYESEHTKFMREWMKQHPIELDVQKSSRALWWDRGPRSVDEQARLTEARVPHKAYYYDAN
jgi:hypothetical protein